LTTADGAEGVSPSLIIDRAQPLRRDQPIAKPLVRPLEVIVDDVL
jgi:hypothetical protein